MRRLAGVARWTPALVFLAVYLPAAGHGFIKDDFGWVLSSRIRSAADFAAIWTHARGFYRPIVALTFAVDEWIFGAHPLGYGLTNVALALACAWSIGRLGKALGLPSAAAWMAGAIWLLNPHGVSWGVLWTCGRTSLIVTLAATACATALLNRRVALAAGLLAIALLSKEEAIPVFAILAIWLALRRPVAPGTPSPWRWLAWAAPIVLLYLAARSSMHMFSPFNAPPEYRYVLTMPALIRNGLEYVDRSSTLALVVLLTGIGVLGWRRDVLDAPTGRIVLCGLIWLALGFAPTIAVPVRSDLYALLPSVGGCLAVAAVLAGLWEHSTESRRRLAPAVAIGIALALAPILVVRAEKWERLGDLSAGVLRDLQADTSAMPEGAVVAILEKGDEPQSVAAAFGDDLSDPFYLVSGRRLTIRVTDEHRRADLWLGLRNGRLVPIPAPAG